MRQQLLLCCVALCELVAHGVSSTPPHHHPGAPPRLVHRHPESVHHGHAASRMVQVQAQNATQNATHKAVVKDKAKVKADKKKEVVPLFTRDSYDDKCTRDFERQQCDGLSCGDAGKCRYCLVDADCHTHHYLCSPSKHGSMFDVSMPSCGREQGLNDLCLCYHKQLLPLDYADAEGIIFTFLACTLAALAGIGGGGLLVPLYVLIENFEADMASPLSSAAIMGGSVVGFAVYCTRWHEQFPAIQRPLIDYETTALLLPALLAGTIIGTVFDKLLPLWSIITVMFALLLTTTFRTGMKAHAEYLDYLESEESCALEPQDDQEDAPEDAHGAKSSEVAADAHGAITDPPGYAPSYEMSKQEYPLDKHLIRTDDNPPEKEEDQCTEAAPLLVPSEDHKPLRVNRSSGGVSTQDQKEDYDISGSRFPLQLLGFIVLVWGMVVLTAWFKGGSRMESVLPFVSCNNAGYWCVHGAGLVVLFVCYYLIRRTILTSVSHVQGDICWDQCNTITVPLLALPGGIVSALCGIGGGMIIGPILLELGARTKSIPATSTFVVLVTASSSTVQFVLVGKLPFFYALAFGLMGALGTFTGIQLQDLIMSRTSNSKKANLFIMGVITMILLLSTVLMGYSGVHTLVRMAHNSGNLGLRNLCH